VVQCWAKLSIDLVTTVWSLIPSMLSKSLALDGSANYSPNAKSVGSFWL